MDLSPHFYKRRIEDVLALPNADDSAAPEAAVASVATEDELLAVTDDVEFVRQAYLFYLKREPDLEGRQFFAAGLRRGGRRSVMDALRSSSEASQPGLAPPPAPGAPALSEDRDFDRRLLRRFEPLELTSLLDIAGDDAFVTTLYEEILGRPADPQGFAHHLDQLSAGLGREALIKAFSASLESQRAGRPLFWGGRRWPVPAFGQRLRRAWAALWTPGALLPEEARAAQAARVVDRLLQHHVLQREALEGLRAQVAALREVVEPLPQRMQSLTRQQDELTRAGSSRGGARSAVVTAGSVVASEVRGFIVGVPAEEWRVAAHHAFRGALEPGLLRSFEAAIAPGMTVVDIGANLGMFTLVAARAAAPGGRVHSFEPTPRLFSILKDNVQVNGLLEGGIVSLHQAAVTDRTGTGRLVVYAGNSGHNTLFPGTERGEWVEVSTVTLDEALADVPRVDVIKIDAEGAEPVIWDGMARTLDRNPRAQIFMEFCPANLRRAGHDPQAFLARLTAAGFTIRRIHGETGAAESVRAADLAGAVSDNVLLTRSRS